MIDPIPFLARTQAALATAVGALLGRSARGDEPLPPLAELERIIVIRPDELGDVVLSTAFLRELRRAAPRARITMVVQPGIAEVLRRTPYVDELVTYDTRCRRALRPFLLPLRALRFGIQHLRPLRAELALLPRWDGDQVYATMLMRFTGARYRVGFSHRVSAYRRRINAGFDTLLTHALDARGTRHEVERSLELLRWLGAEPANDAPELAWGEDAEAAVDALLDTAGPDRNARWVALCPSFGHSALKQWPAEHFAELARRLDARGDVRVLVTGSADDGALAAPIVRALDGRALDLTGKTTLRQLAALLSRCAAFVGADTGAMHIAAAVGTPTIGLFGPTNTLRFAPWGQQTVTLDLPCSPLHRNPEEDRCRVCIYGTPRCMTELPPALVYASVARLLDGTGYSHVPADSEPAQPSVTS